MCKRCKCLGSLTMINVCIIGPVWQKAHARVASHSQSQQVIATLEECRLRRLMRYGAVLTCVCCDTQQMGGSAQIGTLHCKVTSQ